MSSPKILYYDVEIGRATFEFKAYDRKLHTKYLPSHSIKHPKWMICAAWKWLHEHHTTGVSVLNDAKRFADNYMDDYFVVKTLRDEIEKADIIIVHNANNFDWKELKAKIIYHRLPPLKEPVMIDTLKAARESRFMANDMRYLCEYLDADIKKGRAADTEALDNGCPIAIKEETRYCMKDVRAGIELYKILRPYMKNHPNTALMKDGVHHDECKYCSSSNLIKRGYRYMNAGKYQSYHCKDCGGWMQGKKNLKHVNLR